MKGIRGRAEALAAEFRRENEALIALVTSMDEHDWTADCPQEGRSVGDPCSVSTSTSRARWVPAG